MAGNFNQSGCAPCCGGGGGGGYGDNCSTALAPATWSMVWSGTYQWEGWGCPAVPACAGSRNGNYYNITNYGGSVTLYQCAANPCFWDSAQNAGCTPVYTNAEYHTFGNLLHQVCTNGVLDAGNNYPMRAMLAIDYANRSAQLAIAAQTISVADAITYGQLVWDGRAGLPGTLPEFNFPITFSSVNCFTGFPWHVGGSATITPNL